MTFTANSELITYRKYYLYHIVNPDEVLAGKKKPKLVERGPYVYRELNGKHDIKSLEPNQTNYTTVTTLFFEPDLSNGNSTDNITFLNIPAVVINIELNFF